MRKLGVKMELKHYDINALKPEMFLGKPVRVEDQIIGRITDVEIDRSRGYPIVYVKFDVDDTTDIILEG